MIAKTTFTLSLPIFFNTYCEPRYPGFHKLSRKPNKNSRIERLCAFARSYSLGSKFKNKKNKKTSQLEQKLQPLWDDGHGTQNMIDLLESAKSLIEYSDGGSLRWFCPVECGPPLPNSPVLLFIPGLDGTGLGLFLHQKALGKVFEVRCLHVPVHDRTTFKETVKFVENSVRDEHALFPDKPIYLVGDSFGACVALSMAASNPTIDLVLILLNPVTTFNGSPLQLTSPLLDQIPKDVFRILHLISCLALGNSSSEISNLIKKTGNLSVSQKKQFERIFLEVSTFLNEFSSVTDIFPKKTMQWKLKMLKDGMAHTNSRLHAVKAEVLLLASGNDTILSSESEARRISNLLTNCTARLFKNYDHALLLESGLNLLSVIKGTCKYRRSRKRDYIKDFIPPSMSEYEDAFDQKIGLYHMAISPVVLSTLSNGDIVRGLKGVPDQGPVLLVGYHMLFGVDLGAIIQEFLREKNIMVHGLAHPYTFRHDVNSPLQEISVFDCLKIFGAVPAVPSAFYKILSNKGYGLLYPGGAREALHRKGEEYKLFWPEMPEFVRMAARFGAKIVPFGAVGEDDLVEHFFDYNDMLKNPIINNLLSRYSGPNFSRETARNPMEAAVNSPDFFIPGFYPKLPGRIYIQFGKPIETMGREDILKDEVRANEFYLKVKSDVEKCMAYLIKKRENDPNRQLLGRRMIYHALSAPSHQIPTFEL